MTIATTTSTTISAVNAMPTMAAALAMTLIAVSGLGLTCEARAQGAPSQAAPAPAAGSGWNAQVATGTSGIALDEKQTEVVKRVSGYFGTLENLKGSFVQTGADKKRMRGKFFLQRPGKFRFDYSPPSKQVIISDGQFLAVQDHDINTEDRVSLDQTAFRILLRKDVDLIRDAKITEIQSADDTIVVALQDKSPDTPGRIKLFFSTKPEMELKEWVTLDAQGLETRVEVSELVKSEKIDAGVFKIQSMGMPKSTPP